MITLDELAANFEDAIVGSLDTAQIAAQFLAHTNGTVDQLLTAALSIARKQKRYSETLERTLSDTLADRDNLEREIQELEAHLKRHCDTLNTVHWAFGSDDQ